MRREGRNCSKERGCGKKTSKAAREEGGRKGFLYAKHVMEWEERDERTCV